MVKNYPLLASIMLSIGFVILLISLYSAIYNNQPKSNIFCGGIANISCPVGYTCRLDGQYPDATGNCVRNFFNFSKPSSIPTLFPVVWRTYQNPNYGFSFKYPSSAKLTDINQEDRVLELLLSDNGYTVNFSIDSAPIVTHLDSKRSKVPLTEKNLLELMPEGPNQLVYVQGRKANFSDWVSSFELNILDQKRLIKIQAEIPDATKRQIVDQIKDSFIFIDAKSSTNYSCQKNSDCGIYSCGCIGQNIDSIPKGAGCAQECPGVVSCVDQKCLYQEKSSSSKFTCPTSEWVNCMPVVGGPQNEQCNQDFLTWTQKNCPNFKGAAY